MPNTGTHRKTAGSGLEDRKERDRDTGLGNSLERQFSHRTDFHSMKLTVGGGCTYVCFCKCSVIRAGVRY